MKYLDLSVTAVVQLSLTYSHDSAIIQICSKEHTNLTN
jgi:hypothetical protein